MKRKTLATLLFGVMAVSSVTVWRMQVAHAGEVAKNQALHAEVLRLQSEVQTQMEQIQVQAQAKLKEAEQARPKEEAKAKEATNVAKQTETVVQASLQSVPQEYKQFVLDASKESGVAPELIAALGEQESGWDCTMLGSAGDTGCLQIIPNTGAWAMREMGFSGSLWNPQTNIRVGAWVLSHYTQMEGGDVSAGLSAYNGGPQWRSRAPEVARGYASRVLNRVVVVPPVKN